MSDTAKYLPLWIYRIICLFKGHREVRTEHGRYEYISCGRCWKHLSKKAIRPYIEPIWMKHHW